MTLNNQKSFLGRQAGTLDEVRRQRSSDLAAAYPAMVGRVFANPSPPSSANAFVSVHPVSVDGAEVEGGPGGLQADSSRTFLIYALGQKPPAVGDDLVCRFVGHRWVADRMTAGGSTVTIPGCTCVDFPSTLNQTVTAADAGGTLVPCVYTNQPAPDWLVWPQPTTFLSPKLVEPLTNSTYSYQFYCLVGYYVVRKVYWPDAQFPSGRVGPPVWRFFPSSLFGNSCAPFRMVNGAALAGLSQQIGLKVQG